VWTSGNLSESSCNSRLKDGCGHDWPPHSCFKTVALAGRGTVDSMRYNC
jgi:hypothetical protein